MQRVQFNKITIEGFGSIHNSLTFKFRDRGLQIIRGQNGVGKTSIFSALYWVIYGKPAKEGASVETWEEVRTKEYRGTRVDLRVEIDGVEYHVTRCLNFKGKINKIKGGSRLIIESSNDEEMPKDKRALQNWFIDKLQYSPELFKNSVLFGQKLKRLIEESGAKRKEIFEELTNVSFLKVATENAKLVRKDLQSEVSQYEDEEVKLETDLAVAKDELEDIELEIADFEQQKAFDITQAKADVKDFKKQLDNFTDTDPTGQEHLENEIADLKSRLKSKAETQYPLLISSESKLKTQRDKCSTNITRFETKQQADKDALKALKSNPSKCGLCGNKLDDEHFLRHKKKLNKSIKELNSSIETEVEARVVFSDKLRGVQKKIQKHEQWVKKQEKDKARLDKIEADLERIIEAIGHKETAEHNLSKAKESLNRAKNRKLTLSSKKYHSKCNAIKGSLEEVSIQLRKRSNKLKLYDWALKGPLSNAGLKTIILQGIIQQINEEIKNYYQFVGFEIEFFIDEEGARKDIHQFIYKKGIVKMYNDLSGGQKQLVDICTAFAIEDVVSNLNGCNVVLMDEVFESLSQNNIELVGDMVNHKAQKKFIALITHHESFNPQSSSILELELDNDITTLR